MGRRKKSEELEIEVESKEPTDESEDTDNAEQLEQEALAEVDTEEGQQAAEASEAQEEKAPAKPKRQRRPRKKKEAEPTLMNATPIAPPTSAEPLPIAVPAATAQFVPNADHLREDATMAEVSIHKSMDSMARQWAAVKDISTSVCSNLERVAGSLNDLETKYATASQELNRQTNNKSQFLNRIAVGASAMALVMSLLSLALSQSARQNALKTTAQAKMETAPLKGGLTAETPRMESAPIAREPRKEPAIPFARSSRLKAERKGSVRK